MHQQLLWRAERRRAPGLVQAPPVMVGSVMSQWHFVVMAYGFNLRRRRRRSYTNGGGGGLFPCAVPVTMALRMASSIGGNAVERCQPYTRWWRMLPNSCRVASRSHSRHVGLAVFLLIPSRRPSNVGLWGSGRRAVLCRSPLGRPRCLALTAAPPERPDGNQEVKIASVLMTCSPP